MAELTLKELMQLCYNAGREAGDNMSETSFQDWWDDYGEERHDEFSKTKEQRYDEWLASEPEKPS